MLFRRPRAALLPLACLLAVAPGCVWYGPHSMTRLWGDRNTLDRPALFVERLSHAPPPRERVERFRWQYGVGPGFPFVSSEATVVAAPPVVGPAAGPGVPPTLADPAGPVPPAAPPPEPIPNSADSAKPRANLAWLFTPARG